MRFVKFFYSDLLLLPFQSFFFVSLPLEKITRYPLKMNKIAPIIHSMRLRTLPLSLSGVILGLLLAVPQVQCSYGVVPFLLLTTVCLQILSNLSNELGDFLSGTDGDRREGPMYSLAEGRISVSLFRRLIGVFVALCCVFGLSMVWLSFGNVWSLKPLALLALGAAAIWAAMHYTLGKNPYGYRGLGDVFVFIFFGLTSVLGSYFVMAHSFNSWTLLLPATTIGCFSVGVLNVNNIRDIESDRTNRVTVPIKIGVRKAKIYQTTLVVLGWGSMLVFSTIHFTSILNFLYLITLPLYILHLVMVWKRSGKNLDPALPLLVLSTFVFAVIAGLCF